MIIVTSESGKVVFGIPKINIINLNWVVEDNKVWVRHYENGLIKSVCVKETLQELVIAYNEK